MTLIREGPFRKDLYGHIVRRIPDAHDAHRVFTVFFDLYFLTLKRSAERLPVSERDVDPEAVAAHRRWADFVCLP